LEILTRVVDKVGEPALVSGEFRGHSEGMLVVKRGETEETFSLPSEAMLFRDLDGARTAVSEIQVAVGEEVRLVQVQGRISFLEVVQSRLGAAADRGSRYYRWEVRLSPAEVERAVARYGSVGAVRDLQVRRLGVSGRVSELAVIGDEGELVLTGMKVRWGLGLRENLFVIERERDAQRGDAVARFVFVGKGWGHGVGLCQVGAFGMARAGSSFDRILAHYYTGTTLQRAY